MEYILDNPAILLLSGIIGLVFVFVRNKWVSNQPVGNKKMETIAKNISDGAMSFLKAETLFQDFQDLCSHFSKIKNHSF